MHSPYSRVLLVALAIFGISAGVRAQQSIMKGYLKDSLTHLPIAGGSVSNSVTKRVAKTDPSGFFYLPVAPNDVVYATAKEYRFDTLTYSMMFQDTITIYLAPAGDILQAVTVTAGYQKYQMDSAARRSEFEKARGNTMPVLEHAHPGFGLVLNMDRVWKSKDKEKQKTEEKFSVTEREAYIDFRFSPQLVAYYTGLKADDLLGYMRLYRPSYEWLRQHPYREQLIDYLSGHLKDFQKLKK